MVEASALHGSLYREHIEEASFLFGQRQQWLEDPQLTLADVEQLEERLEAHLDALVVGADGAWPRCCDAIASGDAGDLHAAIRVGCRNDQPRLLTALEARLDVLRDVNPHADADALSNAAALALAFELGPRSEAELERALSSSALVHVLGRAIGYRRIDIGDALLHALDLHPSTPPALIWALGELRHRPARDRLTALAVSPDHVIARAATIAALKLGDRRVLNVATTDAIVLALVDDDAGERVLAAATRDATPDNTHALGLSGAPRALAMLVELLGEHELAQSAAAGLLLATGVALLEPELEPDFASLTGEQEEATSRSRLRLCRDGDTWRDHLREGDSSLPRTRMGRMPTMFVSAGAIATLAVPMTLRAHLCDELAIRYRQDVRLRPDMPARIQRRELAPMLSPGAA